MAGGFSPSHAVSQYETALKGSSAIGPKPQQEPLRTPAALQNESSGLAQPHPAPSQGQGSHCSHPSPGTGL